MECLWDVLPRAYQQGDSEDATAEKQPLIEANLVPLRPPIKIMTSETTSNLIILSDSEV